MILIYIYKNCNSTGKYNFQVRDRSCKVLNSKRIYSLWKLSRCSLLCVIINVSMKWNQFIIVEAWNYNKLNSPKEWGGGGQHTAINCYLLSIFIFFSLLLSPLPLYHGCWWLISGFQIHLMIFVYYKLIA